MKKNLLICLLTWVMCMPAFAQETFTVFDGTTEGTGTSTALKTNEYVPAVIGNWHKSTRSQFVIPASYLADIKGGDIASVKFYTTSAYIPYTSLSTADVYVKEVNYTVVDNSALEPKANCAIVYQGTVSIVEEDDGGSMTITFTAPYKYRGGNLLIGIDNTTNAGWRRILFRGQGVMWHASAGGYQMTETYYPIWGWDFIPKTTFTYTPGTLPEEFYLVGTFNGWSQAEDGGRLAFAATEEEGIYETEGTLEDNAEFKVITPDGDGWIWYGGVDENNVGYFLINNDLLNQPLAMVDGANFRIEQGGKFTFRVNVTDMTLTVIPVVNPGIIGDVNCDGYVTSVDITCLYNYLLNNDQTYIATSDVDGDGSITSADIMFVYNILLENE